MKRIGLTVFVSLLCAVTTLAVRADSWLPPETRSYLSADGAWRLTIHPRRIASPLAYFEDKVADRPSPGAVSGSAQRSAFGVMEHLERGRWHKGWQQQLVNEVAPVDALVTNSGAAATLDNWHSMGHGNDAVAIYDSKGKLIRALGLSEFLPKEYIAALPHTVSSIGWRGEARTSEDGRYLVVPVVVPSSNAGSKASYVDVSFEFDTGRHVDNKGVPWEQALASASAAYRKLEAEEAAARQRFIAPLAAPRTKAERDWYDYLIEAFFRVDPDWEDGYPDTNVIPMPDQEKYELLSRYVGESLSEDMNRDGVIMIASPSQDVLVSVLRKQAAGVPQGFLAKARVYVAVDHAHASAARQALSHTGATFIQIDINKEIPQRKTRLDRYLQTDAD